MEALEAETFPMYHTGQIDRWWGGGGRGWPEGGEEVRSFEAIGVKAIPSLMQAR